MSASSANAELTISSQITQATRKKEFNTAKALELRFKGLTYEEIGSVLDSENPYTPQTVQYHLQRFQRFIENPQDLDSYEQNRSKVLNALELELLRSLSDPAAIEKAGLRDRTIAFGTVFDKRRLESGQATQNLGVLGKIVVEAVSEIYQPKAVSKRQVDNQVETKQHETRMDTGD